MKFPLRVALSVTLLLGACAEPAPRGAAERHAAMQSADHVFLNGYVYTADRMRRVVQAVAVRGDTIIATGDDATIRSLIGPETVVTDLDGRMMLPGLQDAHIHALEIESGNGCDLENRRLSLRELSEAVRGCAESAEDGSDGWLVVAQWNFAQGNEADARFSTLREALDAASAERAVMLRGSDDHHFAVNTAGLSRATAADGRRVPLSAATLAGEFSAYRKLVGVDRNGEPDGGLNGQAATLVNPSLYTGFIAGLTDEMLSRIARRLSASGITSILDPAATPAALEIYRRLARSDAMSFRAHAAVLLEPERFVDPRSGAPDPESMVAELVSLREKYRGIPHLHVDGAKIFVDGVIEGNPRATPPTLPIAATLRPYLQPLFRSDPADGRLQLTGYVDATAPPCPEVRDHPDYYTDTRSIGVFHARHGFLPAQCASSAGLLRSPEAFIKAYARGLDRAGFLVHAHAIGDRAVRVALEAFAALREEPSGTVLPHAIAHAQLIHPEDQRRLGELALHVVFTFAWATPDFEYDMSVIPFIDRLASEADLYAPGNYYMQNVYPAASLARAGAVVVAGSDAPVDTRDPRPFTNIEYAVTRGAVQGLAYNRGEALDIHQAIAAYTINAAEMMRQAETTGSIEAGKRADLVVLDQNLVELIDQGRAEAISETRVLMTLFEGRVVYRSPEAGS